MTSNMPATTRITQETAPCGGPTGFPFLPRTGLNLAISAMVASVMKRRACLPLLAALSACGARRKAPAVFPDTLAGWTRTSLRDLSVSDAPDPVPRNSVVSVQAAQYEGMGKLEARAYELTGSAAGLDIAQRWRPSADTVFFWAQRWFVVIRWQEADRRALQEFTSALEKRLNEK